MEGKVDKLRHERFFGKEGKRGGKTKYKLSPNIYYDHLSINESLAFSKLN